MIWIAFLLLSSTEAAGWTPSVLLQFVRAHPESVVIDPDNFLSPNATQTISATIRSNLSQYDTRLILVDKLDDSFYSYFRTKKDVTKFTELFIHELLPELSQRDNSLVILYAISDRVYRIRTGKNVREKLADSFVSESAKSIKWNLILKRYDAAFIKLTTKLAEGPPAWHKYLFVAILIFFAIVIIIILVSACMARRREAQINELASRLQTLNQMQNSNVNFREFRQENCVICLERFASIPDSIFLPCGHNFHKECIESWIRSKQTCPICRINIAQPNENVPVREVQPHIVNVYRDFYAPVIGYSVFEEVLRSPSSSSQWSWNRATRFGNGGYRFDSSAGGTAGSW